MISQFSNPWEDVYARFDDCSLYDNRNDEKKLVELLHIIYTFLLG